MAKITYKLASNGVELKHLATGTVIEIAEFEVKRNGRIQVVHIVDRRGTSHKIARHKIDETDYSLGEEAHKPPTPLPGKKTRSTVALGFAKASAESSLTKEELVALNDAAKTIFDWTHKRLVRLIVPDPVNAVEDD